MSSSSHECVATPPSSRPISGSSHLHDHTSALVSLLPNPSCSVSASTLPAATSLVTNVPASVDAPGIGQTADPITITAIAVPTCVEINAHPHILPSNVGREDEFLCTAKNSSLNSTDTPPLTPSETKTPTSQMLCPTSPTTSLERSGRPHFRSPLPLPSAQTRSDTSILTNMAEAPQGKVTVNVSSPDFPQRLRSTVQQQRGRPATDAAARVRGAPTVTVTDAVVVEEREEQRPTAHEDAETSSGSSSDLEPQPLLGQRGKCKSAPGCPPPHPAPVTTGPPPPCPAAALPTAAELRRFTAPVITAMMGGNAQLGDVFNLSSLAQCGFNRSVASITTRPPATASTELIRRRENGVSYINNYRILKSLGRGSCGKVKLAYDENAKRMVAIKTVRRADTRKRIGGLTTAQKQYNAFMREIDVMKKLRHRNIVSLYEVIDDPSADKLYLIMQYVDKGVIAKVEVHANSDRVCDPIPPAQLYVYAREMLTGLHYLHRHDVVHRDLKPDNILVSKDGHAYLADFGVAETFDTSYRVRMEAIMAQSMAMSMAMSVAGGRAGGPQVLGTKGTPLFIAPELWDGAKSYGKPVDMWAMGVTLFTLLVGKLPFASPEDITDRTYTPVVPTEFGEKWRVLLSGLLNRDPKLRWTIEKTRAYVKFCMDATTAGTSATPTSQPENTKNSTASKCDNSTSKSASALLKEYNTDPLLTAHSADATATTTSATCWSDSLRSDVSASSPHPTRGWEENQISLSDTGSHVLDVDFLPMPDRVEGEGEEAGTNAALSPPAPPLHMMPSLLAIPPSKAMHDAATWPASRTRRGDGDENDEATSPVLSGFSSPFDASPAMACVMTPTQRPGHSQNNASAPLSSPLSSGQSGTLPPMPAMPALQRIPTASIGDPTAPRGRRSQHRRGNGGGSSTTNASSTTGGKMMSSASRSGTRSRSREPVSTAATVQAAQTAATAALAAQHRELLRLASMPLGWNTMSEASSTATTATTGGLRPPESPTASIHHTAFTRAGSRNTMHLESTLPSEEREKARDTHLLDAQRRISAVGSPQLVTLDGIVMPTAHSNVNHTNGTSVTDNATPQRGHKMHDRVATVHDSQRIQTSVNGDSSAPTVNRIV